MDADTLEQVLKYNLKNDPFDRPRTQLTYLAFVDRVAAGDESSLHPSMVEMMFGTTERPFGTETTSGLIRFTIKDLREALATIERYIKGHPKCNAWPPPSPALWPPPTGTRERRGCYWWTGVR